MYRYRCDQCRTTSPVVRTRTEMHNARDRHRRLAHGGHVPDGEHLLEHRTPGPAVRPGIVAAVLLGLLVLALLAHH